MLEKTDITKFEFPANAKIRISIGGLAYCRLRKNGLSEIHFLSHADKHELELQVYKRNRADGSIIETLGPYHITYGHEMFIESSKAIPPNTIYAERLAGEFDLEKMLNISDDMHDRELVDKSLMGRIPRPTPLYISGCAYYTLEMAKYDFKFFEVPKPGDPPVYRRTRKIGYVMSGKIKCTAEDSLTTIRCRSLEGGQLELPGTGGGINFAYDIVLSNHCVPKPSDPCRGDDPDFHYYYDVLQDPKYPERTFRVQAIKEEEQRKENDLATDVAACNPVVVEPPDW